MATSYELFMMPACPYCRKVLLYMGQHGIELPQRDITAEPAARERLLREGGKVQVPCLFIDGKPLYESDDIIAYLGKAFADGAVPTISAEEQAEIDNGAACPLF